MAAKRTFGPYNQLIFDKLSVFYCMSYLPVMHGK